MHVFFSCLFRSSASWSTFRFEGDCRRIRSLSTPKATRRVYAWRPSPKWSRNWSTCTSMWPVKPLYLLHFLYVYVHHTYIYRYIYPKKRKMHSTFQLPYRNSVLWNFFSSVRQQMCRIQRGRPRKSTGPKTHGHSLLFMSCFIWLFHSLLGFFLIVFFSSWWWWWCCCC